MTFCASPTSPSSCLLEDFVGVAPCCGCPGGTVLNPSPGNPEVAGYGPKYSLSGWRERGVGLALGSGREQGVPGPAGSLTGL